MHSDACVIQLSLISYSVTTYQVVHVILFKVKNPSHKIVEVLIINQRTLNQQENKNVKQEVGI